MSKLPIACGGILLAWSLQAGTIYDSTQQIADGADPIEYAGPFVSSGPLYNSFSTGATSGTLSNLELLLGAPLVVDGLIAVGLYSDSSTTPGGLIASLGTVDDSTLTGSYNLVTVILTANPDLSAGTRYWIGLSSDATGARWDYTTDTSGIGVAGEYYSNSSGTSPNVDGGGYQMEVEVTSTPEPSTFLFGASMLATLAMLRRRGARHRS